MPLKFNIKDTIREDLTRHFKKKYEPELTKALVKLGDVIIDDALNQPPTPPLLTAELRDSFFVFVKGQLVKFGRSYKGPTTTKRHGLVVGFGAEHAVYQEFMLTPEGPWIPSPLSVSVGAGGGFLGTKIKKNARRYKSIVVNELKKSPAFTRF